MSVLEDVGGGVNPHWGSLAENLHRTKIPLVYIKKYFTAELRTFGYRRQQPGSLHKVKLNFETQLPPYHDLLSCDYDKKKDMIVTSNNGLAEKIIHITICRGLIDD